MTKQPERRRRGTPISDGLAADLQALGTILADHTRGLDQYLKRQAGRIEERQVNLLAATADALLPPALDLGGLTVKELKDICRQHGLRGWSKLPRLALVDFLQQELGAGRSPAHNSSTGQECEEWALDEPPEPTPGYPAEASRIERLLLLLLRQLGTDTDAIQAAWQGP